MCQSVLAFCHCDSTPEKNQLMEERFILAHNFRGLVRDCLAPLLWACGAAEHHGRERVVERSHSPRDNQDAKKKRKEGAKFPIFLSRACP